MFNQIRRNRTGPEVIRRAFHANGWKFFGGENAGAREGMATPKPFDLNLFGIRGDNRTLNEFDDLIGAVYANTAGFWEMKLWPATTDPGLHYAQNLMNPEGVAILKSGIQYRGAWKIGRHRNTVRALVQAKPVTVHRDDNLDGVRDETAKTQTGKFGINIHPSSAKAPPAKIGRWSAGCQVIQDPEDWTDFMRLIDRASEIWGPSFSYGILTEGQIRRAIMSLVEEPDAEDDNC